MSVPHPGSDPNSRLYEQLKTDVLNRVPQITDIEYVPDEIIANELRATFDPDRLPYETVPEPPTLSISWYRQTPHDWFRVDYADPNTGFHAGWHQDEDHPNLGVTHFQYGTDGAEHRRSHTFDHDTPSLILWEIIDSLFDNVLPADETV